MRLSTIRLDGTVVAGVHDTGDDVWRLVSPGTIGALLEAEDWKTRAERAARDGEPLPTQPDVAPLIGREHRMICVGINYLHHIQEMGREVPSYPTLFSKSSSALIGARDEIVVRDVSWDYDYEVELGLVIGRQSKSGDGLGIVGYTLVNDVTSRLLQWRTSQWFQGKNLDDSSPLGPAMVTLDEMPDFGRLTISCEINGEVRQHSAASDLVFSPDELFAYIGSFMKLRAGDIIASGTPGGVGAGQVPPRYLVPGDVIVSRMDGIMECVNICVDPITA